MYRSSLKASIISEDKIIYNRYGVYNFQFLVYY